jgi:hypothetical protein
LALATFARLFSRKARFPDCYLNPNRRFRINGTRIGKGEKSEQKIAKLTKLSLGDLRALLFIISESSPSEEGTAG